MDTFYPVKHWLVTLAIGPIVVALYEYMLSNDNSLFTVLELYPIFLIMSFIFSMPMLFIHYLLFISLVRTTLPTLAIKSILNMVTIIGILITFYLIGGSARHSYSLSYSIAVIVCSWPIKISKKASCTLEESA